MSAANVIAPNLLVLGGPSSGKSTYRAQVYQRIENQPGQLRLLKSVGDRTAIESDVDLLVQGLQPMHTHFDTYNSTTFAVQDSSGRTFSLEFADYGGEQVRRMANSNTVPTAWVERARQADSWLYFLRIDPVRTTKSFMSEPVACGSRPEALAETTLRENPTEIGVIETLQRLLFVRGTSLRHPLSAPRLAVLLSCWDELPDAEKKQIPLTLLQQRAPLLSQFIAANWAPDERRVWGLSSTGKALPEKTPDLEFARKGPDHFGYVVLADGKHDRDLTIPVNWLLQAQ